MKWIKSGFHWQIEHFHIRVQGNARATIIENSLTGYKRLEVEIVNDVVHKEALPQEWDIARARKYATRKLKEVTGNEGTQQGQGELR